MRQNVLLEFIGELTNVFANLAFRQHLMRRGLPLTTKWEDVKYDEDKRDDFVTTILHVLRCASLWKTIVGYSSYKLDRVFMRALDANRIGSDKEIEVMLNALQVKIDPSSIPTFAEEAEEQPIAEGAFNDDLEATGRIEYFMVRNNLPMNLSLVTFPQNYLTLHNNYFYERCSECYKMGFMVICLCCGDLVCENSCQGADSTAGNGARHCFRMHGGTAIFLNIKIGSLCYYEGKRIFIHGELFIDKFGDFVAGHKTDFSTYKRFNCDKELVKSVFSDYLKFNTINRIVQNTIKLQEKFVDFAE